jgi:iron-sulfur cluster assembly protein
MHHIVCEVPALFRKVAGGVSSHIRAWNGRRAAGQKVCYNEGRIAAQSPRPEAKGIMINLTPVASTKVKEIMTMQNPSPAALRVAVVGGGCSGFQYHMAFENQTNDTDQIFEFDGLKVAVDQMSSMYLDGIEIDYIETVEGAGFKFNNPNVKSTCGCGSSFSV